MARDAAIPETPCFLAATRAEALLVRGDREAAESALAEAIGCDGGRGTTASDYEARRWTRPGLSQPQGVLRDEFRARLTGFGY